MIGIVSPGLGRVLKSIDDDRCCDLAATIFDLDVGEVDGIGHWRFMALVAVVRAPIPDSRATSMVCLIRVFAMASIIDVDVNFGGGAAKQALLFECPIDD